MDGKSFNLHHEMQIQREQTCMKVWHFVYFNNFCLNLHDDTTIMLEIFAMI